jgi:hypothetical protein
MEEENQEEKIDPVKQKKMERQAITLMIVLILVLASFVTVYSILKPKPYFEYAQLKVYPVKFEGNMMFYSIPLKFDFGQGPFEENVVLRNDPRVIENLSYEVNESLFRIAAVGFTMEPTLSANAVIAAQETSKLCKTLKLPIVFGVTNDPEGKAENVFDCANATNLTRVIKMELGNDTKVFSNDNCIIVRGDNYDSMIKASDKLVVEWLKLITKKNETS